MIGSTIEISMIDLTTLEITVIAGELTAERAEKASALELEEFAYFKQKT
jgi:hypothetical protein